MKKPKRYTCGNGEGMFDDKKGCWITYEEHIEIVNKLKKAINYNQCCMGEAEQLVCEHPKRQRDYYSAETFKCWKCKKIVVSN